MVQARRAGRRGFVAGAIAGAVGVALIVAALEHGASGSDREVDVAAPHGIAGEVGAGDVVAGAGPRVSAAGVLPVASLVATWWLGAPGSSESGASQVVQATLGAGAMGDYEFLPNRRTVWVIHRASGRFANFDFQPQGRSETTGRRSRVNTLDRRAFPIADTMFLLSDRNLTEELWVANKKTGDVQIWLPRSDGSVVKDGEMVNSDLGVGEYEFLPNRRTLWVINRTKGRFANFHFRSDQDRTVLRSRVIEVDPSDFPPADTDYLLSDKNFTELLWVCNRRSGDVQLWQPKGDGNVIKAGFTETMTGLVAP